jgi:hypothetical protein
VREQVVHLQSQVNDVQDVTAKNQNEKNKAEIQVVDLRQNLTLLKDEKTRIQNDLGQA